VAHSGAKLTPYGRLLICERVLELGWTVAETAKAAGVSRATAHRVGPSLSRGGTPRAARPIVQGRAMPQRTSRSPGPPYSSGPPPTQGGAARGQGGSFNLLRSAPSPAPDRQARRIDPRVRSGSLMESEHWHPSGIRARSRTARIGAEPGRLHGEDVERQDRVGLTPGTAPSRRAESLALEPTRPIGQHGPPLFSLTYGSNGWRGRASETPAALAGGRAGG